MKAGIAFKFLTTQFEAHGRRVAKNVSWLLVIPIFLSLLLATGLQNLKIDVRDEIILTDNGIVAKYKSYLKQLFPTDTSSDFQPARSIDTHLYATVIVVTRDRGSVLRPSVFREIVLLDRAVRNFTIEHRGQWKYQDLCAKTNGKCWQNDILRLGSKMAEMENGTFLLKYPINNDRDKHYDVLSLGGVAVNDDDEIVSARSLRLIYFLNKSKYVKDLSIKWEKKFIDVIETLKFRNLNVAKDISISQEDSRMDVLKVAIKYVPYCMLSMILFTVVTCLSPDFLRSKPWIGIVSAVATGMSVISGVGLLMYFRFMFTATSIMVPFLVLGIGMDDTFIMLSAWKKIEKTKSVEEKMAETLAETGVSITFTSVTNIASFVVGIIFSSTPMFRMFCVFMATCLAFDYVYQITFIAAFFVYCGKAEERNLHSLVFVPLRNFSSTGTKSFLNNIFCYVQPESTDKNTRCWFVSNTWENFIQTLTTKIAKLFVIILYLLYLGFAIWGITKLSFRTDINLNVIGGSYRHYYYELQKQYYYQYQHRLQFIILEKLDYADPLVQQKVEETMQTLESDPLIGGSLMTESWLRSYLRFVSDKRISYCFLRII
ncbi:patched domain-containing protein 3-like [Centruroides vittatus]|uniref:patched domain-containing protein 3-like n=1 Tax=Centruroides vittatus TaxID=120091 RepID=UPI003510BAF2